MSNYEARYGRAKRRERDRRLTVILGGVLGLALVVWIFTVVFFGPPSVSGAAVGFQAQSPLQAIVKAQIKAPVGAKVTCGVSARSAAQATVGFKRLDFVAQEPTSQFTVVLNTTHEAAEGVVSNCQLR